MATRVISTSIKLDGEAEFKKQMSSVNSELKTLRTEMAYSEEAFKGQANTMEALTAKDKLLRKEIEQQEEKVRALEKAVSDSTEAYGENDKRTDGWRQSLNKAKTDLLKMNRELEDNTKYLDEARNSADKAADSIDEFGREVQDAADQSEGIADLFGSLSKLKDFAKGGVIGAAAIGGLTAIKDALFEVVDGTKEYRQIMGTLEMSSQKAGYTAEETERAYNRLYGVLGDTQTAATTVANLQAIGMEQNSLMELIDATTGAWAAYGDSIPIDGLSESINETIRSGQVTGTLADVLNWGTAENEMFGLRMKENVEFTKLSEKELKTLTDAQREQYEAAKKQYEETEAFNKSLEEATSAEDKFNIALGECTTDTERANLVMEVFYKQGLSSMGRGWRENNKDILEANEAQLKWEEATGKLGEVLSPAKDAIINFGADGIVWITEKIQGAVGWINDAIDAFKRLNNWLNNDSAKRIEEGQAKAQARIDGSNANGLSYVPFDGYISELHRGEAVLTAQENRVWQQFRSGGVQPQQGVTAEQLQTMLVGTVNALNSQRSGSIPQEITLRLKSDDGQTLGRWMVPFVRSEDKSNPEVVSDT